MSTLCDGLHLRGSAHPYEQIDAVNFSTLKECAKSPKHYRWALENQRATTNALRRGSLTHTAILEPDRMPIDYAVWDGERRGKAWKAFAAGNCDRDVVTLKEYELALRLRDAVHADPVASELVRGGVREPTLLWHDRDTRMRCKGRPDLVHDDHVIVDLKTTACARPFEFGRSVAKYGYHIQAAFYSDGYERVVIREPRYVIVAVESVEPHDVIVYEVDEGAIGPGRDEYARLLRTVKDCQEQDVWPGYAGGMRLRLELPPWARDEDDGIEGLGLEM